MKQVIPNGITFLSLLFGAAALWQFIYGQVSTGFLYTLASIVLDALDGYTARKLNASTRFGRVFDLAVDYIVFGLILVVILFRIHGLNALTIITAFVFISCHTIRVCTLIRGKKGLNKGMPDVLNGIIIPVCCYFGWNLLIVFNACAILMIVPVRIPKLSEFQQKRDK